MTALAMSSALKRSDPNVPSPIAGILAPVESTRWGTLRGSTPSSAMANGPDCVWLMHGSPVDSVGGSSCRRLAAERRGRSACDQFARQDDGARFGGRLAGQSLEHQFGGLLPALVRRLSNHGQKWVENPPRRHVVEYGYRHVLWGAHPRFSKRPDRPEGDEVVCGEQRRRLRSDVQDSSGHLISAGLVIPAEYDQLTIGLETFLGHGATVAGDPVCGG